MFQAVRNTVSTLFDSICDQFYEERLDALYQKRVDTESWLRSDKLDDPVVQRGLEHRLKRIQRRIRRVERKLGIA